MRVILALTLGLLAVPPVLLPPAAWGSHAPVEGFGAATVGGAGQPACVVTSLDDDKDAPAPGTLRWCARGPAYVTFAVAGTIRTQARIPVGSAVTIDGLSAPAPGITLTGAGGLSTEGVHDVVIRGLRIEDVFDTDKPVARQSRDCLSVRRGSRNVVIEHTTLLWCGDGAFDYTGNIDDVANEADWPRDVTFQWNLVLPTVSGKKAFLWKYGVKNLSAHHNAVIGVATRLPEISLQGGHPSADVQADVRNNLIWGPWSYATRVEYGARANIVGNLYANLGTGQDTYQAVTICGGDIYPEAQSLCDAGADAEGYTVDNLSLDGVDYNRVGQQRRPYPAPPITQQAPCDAAARILASAGAPFRTARDRAFLDAVRIDFGARPCSYQAGPIPRVGYIAPDDAFYLGQGRWSTNAAGGACDTLSARSTAIERSYQTAKSALNATYSKGLNAASAARKARGESWYQRALARLKSWYREGLASLDRWRQARLEEAKAGDICRVADIPAPPPPAVLSL